MGVFNSSLVLPALAVPGLLKLSDALGEHRWMFLLFAASLAVSFAFWSAVSEQAPASDGVPPHPKRAPLRYASQNANITSPRLKAAPFFASEHTHALPSAQKKKAASSGSFWIPFGAAWRYAASRGRGICLFVAGLAERLVRVNIPDKSRRSASMPSARPVSFNKP